jgi:hypothetical protein
MQTFMGDFDMCMEMLAWVSAVSEGGWKHFNLFTVMDREFPLRKSVHDRLWTENFPDHY